MSFGRRTSRIYPYARRERFALGLLLLFLALWGGMLVHSYTHRELAPAVHQHIEGEEHHSEEDCSACHIVLPTFYASASRYDLSPEVVYPPKYQILQAASPVLRIPTSFLGRAPPSILV